MARSSAGDEFRGRAMGSRLRLVAVGGMNRDRQAAWAAVREQFEVAEEALSRFRETAELVRLDRHPGAWTSTSRWLYDAAALADRAWRRSGGRFDPRIVMHLERLGELGAPLGPEVANRSWQPGHRGKRPVDRDPRRRRLRIDHPIDLGGVGKGLALRWGLRAAREVSPSLDGLLLDAGGDIAIVGRPGDGRTWRVAIEDARGGAEPVAVLEVGGGAVVTSSIRVREWTTADGRSVHHLLDPDTGEPADGGLLAVTVMGPDPAWSEIATKELFLAGAVRIGTEARARGLAAWWVTTDGLLEMTPAARLATIWEATSPRHGDSSDGRGLPEGIAHV
jgi:thiamine biosynthesis lipoprotein